MTVRENSEHGVFFWSVFSRIQIEYWDLTLIRLGFLRIVFESEKMLTPSVVS